MAANRTKNKTEVTALRLDIARRYLHGEPQDAIAASLGMTQPAVSYHLAKVQAQWRASAITAIEDAKARELARIDALEREYWAAWDASKQERTTSTTASTTAADAKAETKTGEKRTRAQIQKQQRDGNPAFLAGIQWCVSERAKLLGLYAPTKQDVTSGGKVLDFAALMLAAKNAAE
jgi:predicted transcriptional regulator